MPTASEMNTTINKIKAMQSKWGLSQTTKSFSSGGKILASDANSMVDMVAQGKNKSGWSGSITPKVSVGQIIQNITASLNSQADAITAHCPCNCNHCSCNCNHCSCDCNYCKSCSSSCDSGCDNTNR